MVSLDELTRDAFLGGKVQAWQPLRGYRAGVDTVLLAAACPARPGEAVLELGCGVGVASLCLGARVGGLALAGVERAPEYAALARRNAADTGGALEVVEADLVALPLALRERSFDQVILNPPYYDRTRGPASPEALREAAMGEETPIAEWVETAVRRLAPGGWLTAIHRAERLPELVAACEVTGRLGGLSILPIAARAGRGAGRVMIQARKGGRADPRLLAPLVVHDGPIHATDGEDYTPEIRAILRDGAPLGRFL